MAGVVWMSGEDSEGSVELFGQHRPRELVRQGHTAERQNKLRPFASLR